jgi:hypothetical protein
MKYTVKSDRLAGHAQGDTVTDDDLKGANVRALIAGGHLSADEPKKSRKSAEPESEAD